MTDPTPAPGAPGAPGSPAPAASETSASKPVSETNSVPAKKSGGSSQQTPVPKMTFLKARWFWLISCITWVLFMIFYRMKITGREHRVPTGPVLYVANHQSFWDPVIVAAAANPRAMFSMARSTLWDTKWVGWIISSLNAIPVEQGAGDIRSIRKCVAVLKAGESLVLYPEGARTEDGEVHEFAKGIMLLIKQGKPTVVPIGIQGAFEVWRRGQKLPKLTGNIRVAMGKPIPSQELVAVSADEAVKRLEDEVKALVAGL